MIRRAQALLLLGLIVLAGGAFAGEPAPADAKPTPAPPPVDANGAGAKKEESNELLSLDDGFVRDWLLLVGVPFSVNPSALKSREYAEFIYGEQGWAPRPGFPLRSDKVLATKPLNWQRGSVPSQSLALKSFGAKAKMVEYALVYVVAPADMEAVIEISCNRPAQLIVNGAASGAAVKLKTGYNPALVRMADDHGDAVLSMHILDKDRHVKPELKIALLPGPEDDDRRSRSVLMADPAFILFPKPTERISYVLEVMTPEVKGVLDRSLDFILKAQQANGAWSDTSYPDSVGVTALCCLALMAEGNLPRQGPHGKALDRGIEFLLNSFRDEDVCASKQFEDYGAMYGHALSMLALLEVCGNIPWHPEIEDRISKGLQAIGRCQRLDGGWRYEMTSTGESDTSVTTTVLWVLGQARKYGYTVPKESMEKAIHFIEKCGLSDGRFAYRLNGEVKIQPHSGVGVAALFGAGKIDNPLLAPARDLIAQEYERYTVDDLCARRYLLFGSFYASLALYSSGYERWKPWYAKFAQVLIKLQKPGGEICDQAGNKTYTTALAAIILQAPYGYLSIYQK